MEFNLSYDYRSSRWLAVSVTKVESALTVSKEQFSGQILIKAEPQEKFKVSLSVCFNSFNSFLWYFYSVQGFFGKPAVQTGSDRTPCKNVAVTEGNLLTSCHCWMF